jgi:hypothetical protein
MTTITIKAIVKVAETAAETNTATETAAEDVVAEEQSSTTPSWAMPVRPDYQDEFEKKIDDFAKLPADQFMELVEYAKRHNNKFPAYSRFDGVGNANDVYCSALISLTRPWSEEVEQKAFKIFENTMNEKVVKMITVLQAAATAARDSGGDVQTFYCLKEVVDSYMSTL